MTRRVVLLTLGVTSLVVIAFLAPLLSLVRDVAASQATVRGQRAGAVGRGAGQPQRPGAALSVDAADPAEHDRVQVRRRPGQRCAACTRPAGRHGRGDRREPAGGHVRGGRRPGRAGTGARAATARSARWCGRSCRTPTLRAGVGRASLALIVLGAVLLAGAGLVAGLIGRGLVRPLLSVAGTADTLRAGDLSARATPADPAEVRRIADALNGLADRIKDLLQQEREAAADLSHRLRTPADRAAAGRRGAARPARRPSGCSPPSPASSGWSAT